MSRVVFCEDNPMIRKLVQTALRSTTHEVHITDDGKRCLDLIMEVRPDVVFSDVAMPEIDGFRLADAMRATPDLAHIPVVFVTASVQREQIEECFRHGAAGHLAKPFTMAELRARGAVLQELIPEVSEERLRRDERVHPAGGASPGVAGD